jgi:hypothetical protein
MWKAWKEGGRRVSDDYWVSVIGGAATEFRYRHLADHFS